MNNVTSDPFAENKLAILPDVAATQSSARKQVRLNSLDCLDADIMPIKPFEKPEDGLASKMISLAGQL
jgi:hypothetical protein